MATQIDDDTLALLRDSMARYHGESYTFDARRRWLDTGLGYSREAWLEYARLGWLAVALPEDCGGFDHDPRAVAALMEFVGGALALEPVLASAIICARLLSRCRDPRVDGWLEAIGSGRQVFALAHVESADDGVAGSVEAVLQDGRVSGSKTVVLHGDVADRLIVSARDANGDGLALCCVDPTSPGVATTRYRLVDGRGAASFVFDSAGAQRIVGSPGTELEFAL